MAPLSRRMVAMITCTMNISGGHHNPAVTIGLFSAGRISGKDAGAYVVAQLVGALLGAFLLRLLLPPGVVSAGSLGTPTVALAITGPQAVGIEAVLTFFLVSAVYGTAVSPNAPKVGGFGIGLVLLFDILAGGPLSGGVMNPARAFGPAVVSGNLIGQYVWWVGPILGGIIAAQLWERVLLKE
jgi:glycerol uptake facilitator-like aquaporin